jgi:hypothetical protein
MHVRLFRVIKLLHDGNMFDVFGSFTFYMLNIFIYHIQSSSPMPHFLVFLLFVVSEGFKSTIKICFGGLLLLCYLGWYALMTGALHQLSVMYIVLTPVWNFYFLLWVFVLWFIEYISHFLVLVFFVNLRH